MCSCNLLWQVVQRLTSIVNFWGERKVFSPVTVAAFMSAVTSPGMTPSLAVPAPAAAAAPQVANFFVSTLT